VARRGGRDDDVVATERELSAGRQWDEADQSMCVTTCESVNQTHPSQAIH